MGPSRPVLAVCLSALGCGGDAADKEAARRIASGPFAFTASALEVRPCSSITLEWNAPDSDRISIEAGAVTLISGFDQRGAVESGPVCTTTNFALTVHNSGGARTETLTVRALWRPVEIVSFTSDRVGSTRTAPVALGWLVSSASKAVLTRNGQVVHEEVRTVEEILESEQLLSGTRARIDTATTTFILTASNPESSVSREVIVREWPLAVRRFSMNPPAGFGPTRVALTWEAEGEWTQLTTDSSARVDDFPGSLAGTYEVQLEPYTAVELSVYRTLPDATYQAIAAGNFRPPFDESEPNDYPVPDPANTILSAASGAISPATDVDVFTLFAGTPLRIWTTPVEGTTCAFFPTLTLYNSGRAALGRVTERPMEADGICALIDADRHPFTAAIPQVSGGYYFVSVAGDGTGTGGYLLFVESNLAFD